MAVERGGVSSHWGDYYAVWEGEGADRDGGEEGGEDGGGGEWCACGVGLVKRFCGHGRGLLRVERWMKWCFD